LETEVEEQLGVMRAAYPQSSVTLAREGKWHIYGCAGEDIWVTHYTCTFRGWRGEANGCWGLGGTVQGAFHDLYREMAERITSCALTMRDLLKYEPRFTHHEGFDVDAILTAGDD